MTLPNVHAAQLAVGHDMTMIVTTDGKVQAIGVNDTGRLGHLPMTRNDKMCVVGFSGEGAPCSSVFTAVDGLP
jgi:hypothetical protein